MPNGDKAALIVPDYNEADRVRETIEAGLSCPDIGELIVVNDGSTDTTADVLADYKGEISVVTHDANRGKGLALDTGVRRAVRNGHMKAVFLDADLTGIKADHISALLRPLNNEGTRMTIGYLGLRKAFVKKYILNQWGALSGQRAVELGVWDLLSDQDKQGFNVEAALNARLRKAGLHRGISRVALDGVGHTGKHDKVGSWPKALRAYYGTYANAAITYARIEKESLARIS